jgi:hypothetical protein
MAQKRGKRGNIATALASERANFPDGDDGHLGLTAAYVATSGLTSQGPLPPPCSAGRSSRDPVSSPAFRSDIGTWGGGTAPPALFYVVCRGTQIAEAAASALPAAAAAAPLAVRARILILRCYWPGTRSLVMPGFMPGIHDAWIGQSLLLVRRQRCSPAAP